VTVSWSLLENLAMVVYSNCFQTSVEEKTNKLLLEVTKLYLAI